MTAPNESTLWGRLIVGELAAQGIERVCIAPGSRSTPLVVAATSHPTLTTHSILDERAAAYFAVGTAKVSGNPAAVISTSGTGAVNFHPAVTEADQSRTPLIACTADRPPERHGVSANQTIDQSDLYGEAVRSAPRLPEPHATADRQQALRNRVAQAVAAATGTPPGPVHLNIPFRKPLDPLPRDRSVPMSGIGECPPADPRPAYESHPAAASLSATGTETIRDALQAAERPWVVVGPGAAVPVARVQKIAHELRLPVLADPLSGVRSGAADRSIVFGGYDSWLDPAMTGSLSPPDLVVRIGDRPTSKHLRQFVSDASAREILVDPAARYRDPTHNADTVVGATPGAVITALAEHFTAPAAAPAWVDELARREADTWEFVREHAEQLPPEGRLVYDVFQELPSGSAVFVSNSMPVRDADRFGYPRADAVEVFGNRGVSGIDGITSTALGVASSHDGPTVALVGDLAFYHDLTGLLTATRCDIPATFVVINNDGGGIFHQLPIAASDPPFTEHFRTPHGLEFAPVAELYDLTYDRLEPGGIARAVTAAIGNGAVTVLEVPVDAETNHAQRRAFQERLRGHLG